MFVVKVWGLDFEKVWVRLKEKVINDYSEVTVQKVKVMIS